MANFDKLSFTKTWILSKYAKYVFQNEIEPKWKTLNSSECAAPINLSLTPTNFLLVNCENDIQEFINLWNNRDNFKGIFKGNSLLIIHKMKDFLRKFRVQFLDHDGRSAEENCELCIRELSRFIEITPFESNEQFSQIQPNQQQQTTKLLNANKLKNKNSTSILDSLPFNRQLDNFSQSENSNNLPNEKLSSKNNFTLKDLTQTLLERNEEKLPLFYQQQDTEELLGENRSLQEFIVGCLLDPKFPQFVKQVESVLTDILKSEDNPS